VAKPFDVTLARETIKIKSVKFELLEGKIAYIRLTGFQENTFAELQKTIAELEKTSGGLKGIILDLRNNPGGLLEQAVEISDLFLRSGTIVSTRGRTSESEIRVAHNDDANIDTPIIILINKGSASASEIVSAALQDNKRAKIMGTQSFGKGSVQTVIDLGEDTGVKLTVAKYYSPLGHIIDGKGVTPDFVVKPGKIERITPMTKLQDDPQKKAALDYLLNGTIPPPPAPESQPSEDVPDHHDD
jgi:carboxyl-terminal processing protease